MLAFGRPDASALASSPPTSGFVGCLADVVFGGQLLRYSFIHLDPESYPVNWFWVRFYSVLLV